MSATADVRVTVKPGMTCLVATGQAYLNFSPRYTPGFVKELLDTLQKDSPTASIRRADGNKVDVPWATPVHDAFDLPDEAKYATVQIDVLESDLADHAEGAPGDGGGPQPDPDAGRFTQKMGNFEVAIDGEIDAHALFLTAYRQYLEKSGETDLSDEKIYAWADEKGLKQRYVGWGSGTDPLDVIEAKYKGDPERAQIIKEVLGANAIWLAIIPLGGSPFTEAEQAELDAGIAKLGPEELEELHQITDDFFFDKVKSEDKKKLPNQSHPQAGLWMDERREAYQLYLQFKSLPDRLKPFFPSGEDGVKPTAANLRRLLKLAAKLDKLSDADLAQLQAPVGAQDLSDLIVVEDYNEAMALVQSRLEEALQVATTGAGPITWVDRGKWKGQKIGTIQNEPIIAGQRTSRALDSLDIAKTFARRAGQSAAVIVEDSGYVVYKVVAVRVEDPNKRSNIVDFKIGSVEFEDSPDPDDTLVNNCIRECVALMTEDGYLIEIKNGKGVIQRAGSESDHPGGPFANATQTFGPGMQNLSEPEFKKQFELVLRDAAYQAVEEAQEYADKWTKRLGAEGLSAAELAAITQALDNMDKTAAKNRELLHGIDENLDEISRLEDRVQELQDEFGSVPDSPNEAEISELREEISQLYEKNAETDQAILENEKRMKTEDCRPFPLVAEYTNQKRRDTFRGLTPDEKRDELLKPIKRSKENIRKARNSIQDGTFDVMASPTLLKRASQELGLDGAQAAWANEMFEAHREEKQEEAVTDAVLAVGLAIGTAVFSGPLGFALAVGSLALGVNDALDATNEYQAQHAAADMVIDPDGTVLVPAGLKPHWIGVATAWSGVMLDFADAAHVAELVGKAIKAIEAADVTVDALRTMPPGDLQRILAKADLGLGANELGEFAKRAQKLMADGKIVSVAPHPPLPNKVFDDLYGSSDAGATTLITKNPDGTFSLDMFFREGVSQEERAAAFTEELIHAEQLADPDLAGDFSRLTENALENWGTKTADEQMAAYSSKLKLEIDAQKRRLAGLKKRLDAGEISAEDFKALEKDAQDSLSMYRNQYDEINTAIRTHKPPDWLDTAPPPRLHNTPAYEATSNKAFAALGFDTIDGVKLPPDGHCFYRNPRGTPPYQIRLKKGASKADKDLEAQRIVFENGQPKLEKAPDRITEATRNEKNLEDYKHFKKNNPDDEVLKSIKDASIDPEFAPYVWTYHGVFDMLGVKKEDVAAMLREIAGRKEVKNLSTFKSAMRDEMRKRMIKHIETGAVLDEQRWGILMDFLDQIDDPATRGALFTQFREKFPAEFLDNLVDSTNVADGATVLKAIPGSKTCDGIVGMKKSRSGIGPRKSGKYGTEDKSSAGAFRDEQAKLYDEAFSLGKAAHGRAVIETNTGDLLEGMLYFLPTETEAMQTLGKLEKLNLKNMDNFHVAYYFDGVVHWLK